MIGDIINAVLGECIAAIQIPDDSGVIGTAILNTDYSSDKLRSYSMPLILLDMMDGPESRQFLSGGTSIDWAFSLNTYNQAPAAYGDDVPNDGYSASLLDLIDEIRQHFSLRMWLTPAMTEIETNYGFKFTFGGISRADKLEGDGLIMGWRLVFESMAIDVVTNWTEPSEYGLEIVNQFGNVQVNNE
jgi:hypothetical protein